MARVAPPQIAGGLVRHETDQWNLNADAQDARTQFCANFYRAAMNGGYKETP
jgi:hypothetical protein